LAAVAAASRLRTQQLTGEVLVILPFPILICLYVAGSGSRLGGGVKEVLTKEQLRQKAAAAAERRSRDDRECGSNWSPPNQTPVQAEVPKASTLSTSVSGSSVVRTTNPRQNFDNTLSAQTVSDENVNAVRSWQCELCYTQNPSDAEICKFCCSNRKDVASVVSDVSANDVEPPIPSRNDQVQTHKVPANRAVRQRSFKRPDTFPPPGDEGSWTCCLCDCLNASIDDVCFDCSVTRGTSKEPSQSSESRPDLNLIDLADPTGDGGSLLCLPCPPTKHQRSMPSSPHGKVGGVGKSGSIMVDLSDDLDLESEQRISAHAAISSSSSTAKQHSTTDAQYAALVESEGWACEMCTFINEGNNMTCEICRVIRANPVTRNPVRESNEHQPEFSVHTQKRPFDMIDMSPELLIEPTTSREHDSPNSIARATRKQYSPSSTIIPCGSCTFENKYDFDVLREMLNGSEELSQLRCSICGTELYLSLEQLTMITSGSQAVAHNSSGDSGGGEFNPYTPMFSSNI
jgi:hypothetical protein